MSKGLKSVTIIPHECRKILLKVHFCGFLFPGTPLSFFTRSIQSLSKPAPESFLDHFFPGDVNHVWVLIIARETIFSEFENDVCQTFHFPKKGSPVDDCRNDVYAIVLIFLVRKVDSFMTCL